MQFMAEEQEPLYSEIKMFLWLLKTESISSI